ncbi:MAG TPA: hypothetical protein PKA37_08320 [Planctomycetota bacterium]|nr:hypothetical protein [Planctomycetota bacterium]
MRTTPRAAVLTCALIGIALVVTLWMWREPVPLADADGTEAMAAPSANAVVGPIVPANDVGLLDGSKAPAVADEDVEVAAPHILVAFVLDDDGQPVSGARVLMQAAQGAEPTKESITSQDGSASFEFSRPDVVHLSALADGYSQGHEKFIPLSSELEVVHITIIRSRTVRILVRDDLGASARALVEVSPISFRLAGSSTLVAKNIQSKVTDGEGLAEFTVLGLGVHCYRVSAIGFANAFGSFHPIHEPEVRVAMSRSGDPVTIETVDSETLAPVPGVRVLLSARAVFQGSEFGEGITDHMGRIEFIRPEGETTYLTAMPSDRTRLSVATIPPSTNSAIVHIRASFQSYASVRDSAGQTVREAILEIRGAEPSSSSEKVTAGEDGRFVLPINLHRASRFRFRSGAESTAWAHVYPPEKKTHYELVLESVGIVTGHVLDSNGEGVRNGMVVARWGQTNLINPYVMPEHGYIESQCVTDDQGHFALSFTSPGAYIISARHPEAGIGKEIAVRVVGLSTVGIVTSDSSHVRLVPMGSTTRIDPFLLVETGSAEIEVTLHGKPLPHGTVWLVPRSSMNKRLLSAKANFQGIARFDAIPPGLYSCVPTEPTLVIETPPLFLGSANDDLISVNSNRLTRVTLRR